MKNHETLRVQITGTLCAGPGGLFLPVPGTGGMIAGNGYQNYFSSDHDKNQRVPSRRICSGVKKASSFGLP